MDLIPYLNPLRRWWWLIVAATLVAAASSFLATRGQPPIYQARAKLLIGQAIQSPNPNAIDFYTSVQLGRTYAEIAKTDRVRNQAMAALGMNWLPEYRVPTVSGTELLEIIVTDTVPERAKAVANEMANQLILESPTATDSDEQERQDFINGELDDLQFRITETRDEIRLKQDEIKELVSARQIQEVENQIAALQGKLNTLQTNYAVLLANTSGGAINSLSILDPAITPTVPIGPNTGLTLFTASAIGFTLAIGAAYLLEFLDNTIKNPNNIEQVTGLPTLAGIARQELSEEEAGERNLITIHHPRSPISEAYRSLRTGIQFANLDNPNSTLLITSSKPSEGKSLTAANLGVVLAQAGRRVALIDADLRRPVQHQIFDLTRELGLTSLLLSLDPDARGHDDEYQVIIDKFMQGTDVPGLSVLTSGPVPPNPSELLDSTKMRTVLRVLSRNFDYIILDSPPSLAVTDAVILGAQVDSVLLVVDAGKTRREQLKQSVEKLREVNANLIGVVLNRLSRKGDGYGDYYYYYQTTSYYSDDDEKESARSKDNGRAARRKRQRALSANGE
jgi:non-specific protein-tyrosine kinase